MDKSDIGSQDSAPHSAVSDRTAKLEEPQRQYPSTSLKPKGDAELATRFHHLPMPCRWAVCLFELIPELAAVTLLPAVTLMICCRNRMLTLLENYVLT